jgi:DNA-binding NtrC family response regulator
MDKGAIVCVDDEAIILMSLVQELRSSFGERFIYEKASNAEEALEIIDELVNEGINGLIVISDWLMPGAKGDEFIERASIIYPTIKAIMITGMADDEAIQRTQAHKNVVSVLKKPWRPKELQEIIHSCCESNKG